MRGCLTTIVFLLITRGPNLLFCGGIFLGLWLSLLQLHIYIWIGNTILTLFFLILFIIIINIIKDLYSLFISGFETVWKEGGNNDIQI